MRDADHDGLVAFFLGVVNDADRGRHGAGARGKGERIGGGQCLPPGICDGEVDSRDGLAACKGEVNRLRGGEGGDAIEGYGQLHRSAFPHLVIRDCETRTTRCLHP